jgi:hypothetical protein
MKVWVLVVDDRSSISRFPEMMAVFSSKEKADAACRRRNDELSEFGRGVYHYRVEAWQSESESDEE